MKRIISGLLLFVMAVTSFCMPNVKAEEDSEPIVMDSNSEYVGTLNNLNQEDIYRLSIPTSGYITIKAYSGPNSDRSADYDLKNSYEESVSSFRVYDSNTKSNAIIEKIPVKAGNYKLHIDYDPFWDSEIHEYHFTVSYSMNMSGKAKISALKKKVRITAPKNGKVTGYDVRYKQKGTSKWKTKSIKSKKNLNVVISGLKSNKKYVFQVRKKAVDSYGHSYKSSWTKSQTVKVK